MPEPTSEHGEFLDDSPSAGRVLLGTCALLFAAAVVCLAFLEETVGVRLPMPRSWFRDRPLWYAATVAAVVAGWILLRQRRDPQDTWKPERDGVRFHRLVLYTRRDCHLCDLARDTLLKYGRWLPRIEEVDIDADPRLLEKFDSCVPVVEADGKLRFRGRLNEHLLRRLIEGTPPRAPRPPSPPAALGGV